MYLNITKIAKNLKNYKLLWKYCTNQDLSKNWIELYIRWRYEMINDKWWTWKLMKAEIEWN